MAKNMLLLCSGLSQSRLMQLNSNTTRRGMKGQEGVFSLFQGVLINFFVVLKHCVCICERLKFVGSVSPVPPLLTNHHAGAKHSQRFFIKPFGNSQNCCNPGAVCMWTSNNFFSTICSFDILNISKKICRMFVTEKVNYASKNVFWATLQGAYFFVKT